MAKKDEDAFIEAIYMAKKDALDETTLESPASESIITPNDIGDIIRELQNETANGEKASDYYDKPFTLERVNEPTPVEIKGDTTTFKCNRTRWYVHFIDLETGEVDKNATMIDTYTLACEAFAKTLLRLFKNKPLPDYNTAQIVLKFEGQVTRAHKLDGKLTDKVSWA